MIFSFYQRFLKNILEYKKFFVEKNFSSWKLWALICFVIGFATWIIYICFVWKNDVVLGGILIVTIWVTLFLALMSYVISFWDKSVRVVANTSNKYNIFPTRKRNIVTQKNQFFFLFFLIFVPFVLFLFWAPWEILQVYLYLSPIYVFILGFYLKKVIKKSS